MEAQRTSWSVVLWPVKVMRVLSGTLPVDCCSSGWSGSPSGGEEGDRLTLPSAEGPGQLTVFRGTLQV